MKRRELQKKQMTNEIRMTVAQQIITFKRGKPENLISDALSSSRTYATLPWPQCLQVFKASAECSTPSHEIVIPIVVRQRSQHTRRRGNLKLGNATKQSHTDQAGPWTTAPAFLQSFVQQELSFFVCFHGSDFSTRQHQSLPLNAQCSIQLLCQVMTKNQRPISNSLKHVCSMLHQCFYRRLVLLSNVYSCDTCATFPLLGILKMLAMWR